jgi:hypothetical protein
MQQEGSQFHHTAEWMWDMPLQAILKKSTHWHGWTKHNGVVVMRKTYSRVAPLQSQLGQWLSEPRHLWLSSVPPGKHRDSTQNRPWPLPSKSFPVHCLPMILQRGPGSSVSKTDPSDPCCTMETVYMLQSTGSNCNVSFQCMGLHFYQLLMDFSPQNSLRPWRLIIHLSVLWFHKLYFKHSSCTLLFFVCITVFQLQILGFSCDNSMPIRYH